MPKRAQTIKALVMVDIQNDFVPGGALPVRDGHKIIPIVNRLQQLFEVVVATQDWHPADHGSFASNHPGKQPGQLIDLNGVPQILWPIHCVQETHGAAFAPGLNTERVARVFQKGMDPKVDSYSGFFDNGRRHSTGLADFLKGQCVQEVYVAGLATDYCVRFTAIDAVALGFKTHLIEDACRGVNLKPDDVSNAINEMKRAGIEILQSH